MIVTDHTPASRPACGYALLAGVIPVTTARLSNAADEHLDESDVQVIL
jgi:hypothetical protein